MSENEADQVGALRPGTVIKGYRIERELGRGAMAVVYLATQLDLARPVALKVLTAELAGNQEFVTRFFNEAQAAAALNHPNIIQALDAGVTADGIHFFCMEYVDGRTLLDLIKERGSIEPEQCRAWFLEIAQALDYGWNLHKFTHGDLKPENIMVNGQGHAKLADFGLAKVDGHDYSGNVVMLTPLYAPPEMIRGERFVDECRPDIYAFGASLYHALAGSPPFPGTDAQLVISRQLNEPLEPLCHRNMQISREWSDFVGKMLEKDMGQRLGSWQAVIDGLTRLGATKKVFAVRRENLPLSTSAHGAPVRQVRRGISWAGLTILVLILVFLVLLGVYLLRTGGRGLSVQAVAAPSGTPSAASRVSPPSAASRVSPPSAASRKERPWAGKDPHDRGETRPGKGTVSADVSEGAGAVAPDILEDRDAAAAMVSSGQKAGAGEQGSQEDGQPGELVEGMLDPKAYRLSLPWDSSQESFLSELELGLLWLEASRPGPALPLLSPSLRGRFERLSATSGASEMGELADFVLTVVLPACSQLPASLAGDIARVRAQTFSLGRESVRVISCSSSAEGLVPRIEMRTSGRRLERGTGWVNLHQAGILFGLCQHLLNGDGLSPQRRRSYLAYCALSGHGAALSSALSRLPAGRERDQWGRLASFERFRGREREEGAAVRGVRSLLAYGASGSWIGIDRELRRLSALKDTEVCRRLMDLLSFCRESSSELPGNVPAARLLSETQAQLESKDADCGRLCQRLLRWQAWHGRSMGPSDEKRFERVLMECLARIPADGEAGHLSEAVGFMSGAYGDGAVRSAARLREWCGGFPRHLASRRRDVQDVLTASVRLALGDWSYGCRASVRHHWSRLESMETLREFGTDGALLFALSCYGRHLLDLRFGSGDASDRHLCHLLKRLGSSSELGLGVCNLVLEGVALSRHGRRLGGTGAGRQILRKGFPQQVLGGARRADIRFDLPRHRRRFTYLYLSALHEAGESEAALGLLGGIRRDSALALRHGFSESLPCVDLLVGLGGEDASLEFGSGDAAVQAEFLRAALSGLGPRVLADGDWANYRVQLEGLSAGGGLLCGDVIFDVVLRRVGGELAAGRLDLALSEIEWALSLPGSCLFPYGSRLLLLRCGVMLLSAVRSGVADGAVLAGESTVMSPEERRVLEAFGRGGERDVPGVAGGVQARFWYLWLGLCEDAGARRPEAGASLGAVRAASVSLPGGERSLLEGTCAWLSQRGIRL